jgi:hypothetical protein
MAFKWFIQSGESIEGPLTTDDIQVRIHANSLPRNALIWGPGSEAWQTPPAWLESLTGMRSTSRDPEPAVEAWHYAVGGQSYGPMSRENLVEQLKNFPGGEIMLWSKGMKEWAPLYEFHDLLNEVGINKRQYPRADLTGKVVIKVNGNSIIAPLLSISEGGFGAALESGLVAGENLTAELQSAAFREMFHVKAEVRYVGQGVIGFKFTQVSVEARGAIIQFIKQNQIQFRIKAA